MFKIGHSTNGDIIEPKMAISQLSTDHRSYENTETALYSLMKPMPLELSFPTPSEVDADRKYKFSALMLGRKGSIPVLFGIELKRTTTTKNSVVILEPVPEKDLDTQMKEVEGDSSIRCMIIPGLGSEAVCRECLAMHSKWFAIRSYILFYKERRYSAELLVVTSNYESSDIETNCRKNLCSNVFSWDPSDCQIMDSIFPSHRKLFEVHQKKYGLNEEHHICNENAMDLNWIRQVLNVIAFERMQRASRSFGPPQDPFFFSKTLEVLRTKMTLCINVTLFQSARWMCIGCILKNVGGARLLISSSLRNAMILTSDIKSALKCIECSNMMPLEPERCKQYRDESVLNIETFPKPSGYEVLDEAPKNCIVVYYMSSRRNRCLHCMKKLSQQKKTLLSSVKRRRFLTLRNLVQTYQNGQ